MPNELPGNPYWNMNSTDIAVSSEVARLLELAEQLVTPKQATVTLISHWKMVCGNCEQYWLSPDPPTPTSIQHCPCCGTPNVMPRTEYGGINANG